MDWPIVAVQWLHVLAGILWFGASLTTNFVFVPAINRLPIGDQQRVGGAYGEIAGRVLRPAGAAVIVLGVVRGTVFGQLTTVDAVFGTAYGVTWLIALVVALLTIAWAEFAIIPTIRRLNALTRPLDADGRPSAELAAIVSRAKRNAGVEMLGFFTVFTCMILMRFGY